MDTNEDLARSACAQAPSPEVWAEYHRLLADPASRCSLEEVLAAREERVDLQRAMLDEAPEALVCLTLNMAGAVKQFPLARRCFDEACRLLERRLAGAGAAIGVRHVEHAKAGNLACFAVMAPAQHVKRLACAVEEGTPLGRLFDIDVLAPSGEKLSREEIGLPARRCLVCGRPGKGCARSHTHSLEEVVKASLGLMERSFQDQFADAAACLATRALLYEICTTPKPGLVDRNNNGSHADMDMFTFADSISVLTPYFRQCAMAGQELCQDRPERLFERIRSFGMVAEDRMFSATRGVNTHKGAIFLLGILAAAAGWLHGKECRLLPEAVCQTSQAMTACLGEECRRLAASQPRSHGERLLALGIRGARGEAAGGFASVRRVSLPVLRARLALGDSPERAGAVALMHLLARVLDTNAITRTGIEAQQAARARLQALLRNNPAPDDAAICAIDEEYIAQNASPGGCADLLAATWLLHFLENWRDHI
jgi:holo-ACP synthase/triphosphoribosyl-dephospho-CoA synthase